MTSTTTWKKSACGHPHQVFDQVEKSILEMLWDFLGGASTTSSPSCPAATLAPPSSSIAAATSLPLCGYHMGFTGFRVQKVYKVNTETQYPNPKTVAQRRQISCAFGTLFPAFVLASCRKRPRHPTRSYTRHAILKTRHITLRGIRKGTLRESTHLCLKRVEYALSPLV